MLSVIMALSIALGVSMCPTPVNTLAEVVPIDAVPVIAREVVVEEVVVEEVEWINGEATAYFNGKDEMNGEMGICASGYNLDNGIYYEGYRILASSQDIPLGTLVELSLADGSILTGVVLDRGGMITENKFDIVMSSREECMNFGRQGISYRIIGEVEL